MSQSTPTKCSMLFKHNYGKLSWKVGDHSLNFSFVHGPSWLRILESIHRYGIIFTFCKIFSKCHCEAMFDLKKTTFYQFLKVFAWIFHWNWNFLFQVTQWPQNSLIKSFRYIWATLYISEFIPQIRNKYIIELKADQI